MNKVKKIQWVVVFFAFAKALLHPLQAQEDNVLQAVLLPETAVKQMLQSNFGIVLANNQVAIAENNKSLLNAGFLPSLTGNAGAAYDRNNNTTDFEGALNDEGVPRPDIVIEGAESRRYNASLNLDYTLFDGLGRRYNFKQLKETYNLSQLEARETIENTIVQLFSVYYEVARLSESLSILKEALKISKDRAVRAAYRFEYGQANKLELLNAQVDITTDSINMLNAQQQLRNTKRDLNVVLNQELKVNFEVDTTVVFVNQLLIASFVEQAKTQNVRLLQIESEIAISDYAIKGAKSLLLPVVGLTGTYGWNRNENPASTFFPGRNDVGTNLALGANLRWNIFDGGRSLVAIKNAKIAYESQEILRKQLQQEVYRDIANAEGDYKNALAIYKMQEQNVRTNQDNFNRSQERLKLGQITSVEFRQAQLNLLNAEVTESATKYQSKLAELQLLQLTGQLLNIKF